MTSYPKRLIEVDLPIKRVSAHSRREKSIRHGHISTLHIWWARRPLAACRAVVCASLWPDPGDSNCPSAFRDCVRAAMLAWTPYDRQRMLSEESRPRFDAARRDPAHFDDPVQLRAALLDFIADFANWDNSAAPEFLNTARTLTVAAHEALGGHRDTRPLVADPFAGGGSIPLEVLRIGGDAFASDINPVPVLLNKVILEYVPKYGERLADEVRKWGQWIRREAERELGEFYPRGPNGAVRNVYFWARTIVSGAPGTGELPVEVPLLRSMWLSRKGERKFALRWSRDERGKIRTRDRVVRYADGTEKVVLQPILEVFKPRNPSEIEPGTSKGGAATCPITGFTTPVETVRSQLAARRGGAEDARLLAVITEGGDSNGRTYRLAEPCDEDSVARAHREYIRGSGDNLKTITIPDGRINHLRGFFNIVLYGIERWGDLFSPRQAISVCAFGRLVLEASQKLNLDPGLATAVQTCLALVVDRLAEKLTSVARWDVSRENPQGTFGRQALPMVWDFCEVNPLSGAGGDWGTALEWVVKVLETNASLCNAECGRGHAEQASATRHPLPDDSVNAVFTDPPYYAAVPYADLSDFFYSWLRQTVGDKYPTMFAESLSPKANELVSLAHRAAMYREKNGAWFEAKMADACSEARRICQPGGIGVIVFANKETAGWEAMLSALVSSGWIITASWPIDTEMSSRLRAMNSAALASSVHLVCRPREQLTGSLQTDRIGDWRDVLGELPRRIHEWMPRLASEGVVGADAIFACLGPALEIFSRHSQVEKASGEIVALKEYLEHVWAAVAKEALSMIFRDADTVGFEPDARLTAMWLWTLTAGLPDGTDDKLESDEDEDEGGGGLGAKQPKIKGFVLDFDAARKIAQGLGAMIETMPSLVEVNGSTARLLPVAERTAALFGKDEARAPATARKKKHVQLKLALFDELKDEAQGETAWREKTTTKLGTTILDRVHQSMILFAAGRGEAMKRFLVDDGAGRDQKFWSLAQALSALYPPSSDEKRWVDGVLARKKGLGL